jgi:ABC-type multidrug transport system fused ATPase/permease subunit
MSFLVYLWKTKKLIFKSAPRAIEEEEDNSKSEAEFDGTQQVGFTYEPINENDHENEKEDEFDPEKIRFQGITIGFENLGLVLDSGKRVLSNISGELQGGSLTAVMGPSGSGKSVSFSTSSNSLIEICRLF